MRSSYLIALFPLVLLGCPKREEALTRAEAELALDEAQASSQADGLVASSIEISTDLTLGRAASEAAGEIRESIAQNLPCAAVTLSGSTVNVEWGVNPGACSGRERELTGHSAITVEKNENDEVLVHHEWLELSNGIVSVTGTADVTWNVEAKERHVVHSTDWTYLPTGRAGHGEGDRVQTPLAGGVSEGIRIDGTRSWTGEKGRWDLTIDGVEIAWADPVPRAGTYTLATPFEKSLSLAFERADEDTITVTVAGPKRSFSFDVSRL
jgi:hypothetical protein